jgi:tetratricopeptide (TPR) repeat protein
MAYCGYVRAGIRPAASLKEAEACAAKLDALDSRSSAAYLLRANIRRHRDGLQQTVRDLKVVLRQDPNHAEALLELAYAYLSAGRVPAARPGLARLLQVDPLTTVNHSLAAWADAIELRFEDALEHYRKAWEMAPENPLCRLLYGYALALVGRRDDCLAVLDHLAADWPGATTGRMGLILAAGMRGDEAVVLDVGRSLEEAARFDDFFAHRLAEGYALVGRKDEALRWLECAHARGSSYHQMLSASWLLAAIHDDPRFANLMERMKQYSERFEV